jgi:hypothetical protein
MCAYTETDVRESVKDCTLASGEGHGSREETLHPICAASPCPHLLNALYYMTSTNCKAPSFFPFLCYIIPSIHFPQHSVKKNC